MSILPQHDPAGSRDPLLDRVRDSIEQDGPAVRRRDRHSDSPAAWSAGLTGNDPEPASTAATERATEVLARDPAIPDELIEHDREALRAQDDTPIDELRRVATSWGRRALQVGVLLFALVVGYYAVSLWQVYSAGRSDQARPVDAIVVMGAAQYDGTPSPQLAARLDHVVELWPQGYAPLVVVTGGNRPGDRFTEAEASAQYLIERGVPGDAIVLENAGVTSYDSLERVASLLAARSGTPDNSVLVVTDPYHTLRSRLIAEEVGLTASSSPTTVSVVTGARSLERHLWEAGGVAIGRITGFGWLSELTD